jgi:hypothetical protein
VRGSSSAGHRSTATRASGSTPGVSATPATSCTRGACARRAAIVNHTMIIVYHAPLAHRRAWGRVDWAGPYTMQLACGLFVTKNEGRLPTTRTRTPELRELRDRVSGACVRACVRACVHSGAATSRRLGGGGGGGHEFTPRPFFLGCCAAAWARCAAWHLEHTGRSVQFNVPGSLAGHRHCAPTIAPRAPSVWRL